MNVDALQKSAAIESADLHPTLWVSRYSDYLYAFALVRVQNGEQAKDLVQETFLAALENVNSYKKESIEKTWLTGILKNKLFDLYRKQYRYSLHEVSVVDQFFRKEDGHWNQPQKPLSFESGHHHSIESKEHLRILYACIQKLPQAWRVVFTLKHLEDLSSAAVCRQLKLTQANFWVIIHRAKLHLRACLQKNV